jgi:hypothetical protein
VSVICLLRKPTLSGSGQIGNWIWMAALNPGGFFAFVTGAGTLVGTYIAIRSILDLKHTITSFPQLVARLAHLVEEAKGPEQEVLFLAYTPMPGAFAVSDRLARKLKHALLDEHTRIRMACLDERSHREWITMYQPRATLKDDKLKRQTDERNERFIKDCEEVVLKVLSGHRYDYEEEIAEHKRENPSKERPGKYKEYPHEVIRLSWNEMPGYYFFVSSERAIVIAPILMPRLGIPRPGLRLAPDTLGFETTDPRIIQSLQNEFKRYVSWILLREDFLDLNVLAALWSNESDRVSRSLWAGLSKRAREALANLRQDVTWKDSGWSAWPMLLEELNGVLAGRSLYDAQAFAGKRLLKETTKLLTQRLVEVEDRIQLNRRLLEDFYSDALLRRRQRVMGWQQSAGSTDKEIILSKYAEGYLI